MTTARTVGVALFFLALPLLAAPSEGTFRVTTRLRIETPITVREKKPDGTTVSTQITQTVTKQEYRRIDPEHTAIVICDMWDKHWCSSATRRCDALAKKMAAVISDARSRGITIVHCPSECMNFYADHPARKRTLELPPAAIPGERNLPDPPLPINDSDGGCDDVPQPKMHKAWTRQHEAIGIDPEKDFITDDGKQLMAVMQAKELTTVLVMGVHTNMCVLNRSFAIKQLRRWDVKCYLVRDLTDAMYNPTMPPKVSHEDGTSLVIEHIEKYWCPSFESKDLRVRR